MPTSYFLGFDVVKINAAGMTVKQAGAVVDVYDETNNASLGTITANAQGVVAAGSLNVAANTLVTFSVDGYERTIQRTTTAIPSYTTETELALLLEDASTEVFDTPAYNDVYLKETNGEPRHIGRVAPGGVLELAYNPALDMTLELYAIARLEQGESDAFDLTRAVKYTVNPNREKTAPEVFIKSVSNTEIVVGITAFSEKAAYRKIEYTFDADFSVPANTIVKILSTAKEPNFQFSNEYKITRSTSLDTAQTIQIRVSHSSNSLEYSPTSEIKAATFPDDGGSGGSSPEDPPPPPESGGTGDDPPPPPGGGGGCPTLDQYVLARNEETGEVYSKLVADVEVGDFVQNPVTKEFERVRTADVIEADVYEVRTHNGAVSRSSDTHPLIRSEIDRHGTRVTNLKTGDAVLTVFRGGLMQSEIISIACLGKEQVKKIQTDGETHIYAAGSTAEKMIVAHNQKPADLLL